MRSRSIRLVLSLALIALGALLLAAGGSGQQGGLAYSIEFTGTVDPASERWVERGLDDAAERNAEIAIIRLDTPGGLDTSTRSIVQDIIAAPMPVIVYVSPDGARAASAGLFITMAADVAAMSPQTNIGSATPITLGPGEEDEVLGRKIEQDAAAYVRALADGHGRNPELAEEMVREATNVTAAEALAEDLIEVVAVNEEELLAELEGFEVQGPKEQTLSTEGLTIERHSMPFYLQLLQIIVNPNVAFLLLSLGALGIVFEVFNPGMIVPGTVGAISLVLGLYGTALLPVTAVGLILLFGGVGLIIAEAHVPTSGVLGGGGVLALALGGLVLYDTDSDAFAISPPVVIATALLLGGFFAFALKKALEARRNPVMTGWEEMVGKVGAVRTPVDPVGQVFVEGALWRARLADEGAHAPQRGDRVRVESVDGLTLLVSPAHAGESDPDSQEAVEAEGGTQ